MISLASRENVLYSILQTFKMNKNIVVCFYKTRCNHIKQQSTVQILFQAFKERLYKKEGLFYASASHICIRRRHYDLESKPI